MTLINQYFYNKKAGPLNCVFFLKSCGSFAFSFVVSHTSCFSFSAVCSQVTSFQFCGESSRAWNDYLCVSQWAAAFRTTLLKQICLLLQLCLEYGSIVSAWVNQSRTEFTALIGSRVQVSFTPFFFIWFFFHIFAFWCLEGSLDERFRGNCS